MQKSSWRIPFLGVPESKRIKCGDPEKGAKLESNQKEAMISIPTDYKPILGELVPLEVEIKILEAAGPFTQMRCGFLTLEPTTSNEIKKQIISDALRFEWEGDYEHLWNVQPATSDMCQITQKHFYRSLVMKQKAHLAKLRTSGTNMRNTAWSTNLEHVPLRQCWPEYFMFNREAAYYDLEWRYWTALRYGHEKLLVHHLRTPELRRRLEQTPGGISKCRMLGDVKRLHSLDIAAMAGFNTFRLMERLGASTCSHEAMNSAACHGDLRLVRYLQDHRTEGCTTDAMDSAARNGHLEVVKWLHENRTEGCTTSAIDYAAMNGHLEIVKWLTANRTEGFSPAAMVNAASNGDIPMMQWLYSQFIDPTPLPTDYTYPTGLTRMVASANPRIHLQIPRHHTQFLDHNDLRVFKNPLMHACRYGHLEAVKWICSFPGFVLDNIPDCRFCAASSRHSEVATFLHSV